ncbi:MAG: hypothetical protein HYX93_03860 [Chloroflexi bacterium]|nr:hypothetical protein [Chloroflexota bacterium]
MGKTPLGVATVWLVGVALLAACQTGEATPTPGKTPAMNATEIPGATSGPQASPAATGTGLGASSYLLFNQRLIEGVTTRGLDLDDVDEVFGHIFSRLPDEVTVYPSENYYYFIMYVDGQQYWGNMRLPAGRRERGVLSFAYFEFVEFPSVPGTGKSQAKFYTQADGLVIEELDRFTWLVRYNGKDVVFNLHQISQEPPSQDLLVGDNEVFVERTLDESGYSFYLLFNEERDYFLWVLNEEEGVPDVFDPIQDDIVVGKRSGFAFWVDSAHGNRKVLATIRRISVTRNDYYDGPFDQLADNYADEVGVSDYMIKASPGLEGRIDKFGYYTDSERPVRVALSNYGTYFTQNDIIQFVERAKASEDPYQYISRGGLPLAATPTPIAPTPEPNTPTPGRTTTPP